MLSYLLRYPHMLHHHLHIFYNNSQFLLLFYYQAIPLLNIVKHPDKVVNVEECGPNVLKIIFTMDNIKIYMSRPSLFDIPDDVQIRFNDSDIVTGGRGYNAWWGKEYERREADDL